MDFTRTNSRRIFLSSGTLPGYASREIKRCSLRYYFLSTLLIYALFFYKTGRSKHYGFIEFDSSTVAQIVAETMDNYLLMGHILRCKVVPKDQVHPELWVGANRKWRIVPADRVARVEHNKVDFFVFKIATFSFT
jgi:RNA recognition motif-containing protein